MRSTGDVISHTVKNLLMDRVKDDQAALSTSTPIRIYNQKVRELADFLGVSQPYMPRKIKSGSWDSHDLDRLSIYFDMFPQDFVPGPHDQGWGLHSLDRKAARQRAGFIASHQQAEAPEGNASTDVSASGDNPEMHSPEPDERKTE